MARVRISWMHACSFSSEAFFHITTRLDVLKNTNNTGTNTYNMYEGNSNTHL